LVLLRPQSAVVASLVMASLVIVSLVMVTKANVVVTNVAMSNMAMLVILLQPLLCLLQHLQYPVRMRMTVVLS
jgi:hypothetical protein